MNIDLAIKIVAAVAGLVCGLTQTYTNGKALYHMATESETAESTENSDSQVEGV